MAHMALSAFVYPFLTLTSFFCSSETTEATILNASCSFHRESVRMIDVLTEIIINTHINIMMFELGPFEVKMHRKQTPFNLFILVLSID